MKSRCRAGDGFFVVLALLIFSSPIKNGCLRGSPGRKHPAMRQGIRLGRNGRYKCIGNANKIAPTASQRVGMSERRYQK